MLLFTLLTLLVSSQASAAKLPAKCAIALKQARTANDKAYEAFVASQKAPQARKQQLLQQARKHTQEIASNFRTLRLHCPLVDHRATFKHEDTWSACTTCLQQQDICGQYFSKECGYAYRFFAR